MFVSPEKIADNYAPNNHKFKFKVRIHSKDLTLMFSIGSMTYNSKDVWRSHSSASHCFSL